jgi:predicted cupin superfamily sugar epimerase
VREQGGVRQPPTLPGWAAGLGLQAHPEGGWYAETWRSAVSVPATALPPEYGGPRAAATAILFLLLPGERSAWHLVRSDELWFHHRGGPLTLRLGGRGEAPEAATEHRLGPRIEAGERPQLLVPGGVWQSAEPAGEPVLVSCVVAPGFDFADFRLR